MQVGTLTSDTYVGVTIAGYKAVRGNKKLKKFLFAD